MKLKEEEQFADDAQISPKWIFRMSRSTTPRIRGMRIEPKRSGSGGFGGCLAEFEDWQYPLLFFLGLDSDVLWLCFIVNYHFIQLLSPLRFKLMIMCLAVLLIWRKIYFSCYRNGELILESWFCNDYCFFSVTGLCSTFRGYFLAIS